MIGHLSDAQAVALSIVVWIATSMIVGRRAVGWGPDRLDRAGPLTTIRAWERGGRFWQRHLRVLRWKDRLPDAGAFFAGGRDKRSIGLPTTANLEQFRRETIRAERVHWLILASGPIHLLWCPPLVGAYMVAFGIAFDAPFIVVQRVNRGRLERLLARRSRGVRARG